MAASCCSTSAALFPLWRPRRRHGIVPSDSGSQRLPDRRVGLSFRTERRLRPRKSASRLCVFRLGDTKPAVVTGKTWDKLILESDTLVLVEFYTNWCGPCRMVHRVIDEIATEYSSKINCFVLDADCDSEVAENYDIKAVPVVLLFKNGKKLESITGTMPKEFYVAAIERVLAS